MKRLFIAIAPPPEFRERLFQPFRSRRFEFLRRVPLEQAHITLAFLGDVEEASRKRLLEELAKLAPWSGFRLLPDETTLLPSRRAPKAFCATLTAPPEQLALKSSIDKAIAKSGLPTESRPYRPHITLGRLRAKARLDEAKTLPSLFENFEFPSFEARAFALYSSVLTPDGAIHEKEASFEASR